MIQFPYQGMKSYYQFMKSGKGTRRANFGCQTWDKPGFPHVVQVRHARFIATAPWRATTTSNRSC